MPVPQFNLSRVAERIHDDLWSRWRGIVQNTAFVGGAEVDAFEASFGDFLDGSGCVGVANGTDALELALRAFDVREGDEVIVPAYTFIATAASVLLLGGRPVFVDVEPGTLNIDPARVEESVTERTVGVIAVHLYGTPCDLERLSAVCDRQGLWLLEDAAQAHGARYDGRRVGTTGRLATWSFYPSKNLGCFGDGGAVTGSDPALLDRVRSLANHGRQDHFTHGEPGVNSRLDALQAAVLNCRLPLLDQDNERRRCIAHAYREALEGLPGLRFLEESSRAESVYHQLTVLHDDRDALREHLTSRGIGTAVHYPRALHQQAALAAAAGEADLPVAESAPQQVLCLPMFAELTDDEVVEVCEAIRAFDA